VGAPKLDAISLTSSEGVITRTSGGEVLQARTHPHELQISREEVRRFRLLSTPDVKSIEELPFVNLSTLKRSTGLLKFSKPTLVQALQEIGLEAAPRLARSRGRENTTVWDGAFDHRYTGLQKFGLSTARNRIRAKELDV